jgi:hypothetical protein
MMGILNDRAVLRISGEESRAFLQGLLTQDIEALGDDDAAFAALLTPQGKILFDFILVPVNDGFFIDCERGAAQSLLKRLSLYKLRAKIALTEEPGLRVAVGAVDGAIAAYDDPRHPTLPRRLIATTKAPPAIDNDYDQVRLDLGIPEFGKDFAGEEVFLLDVNYDALHGVSYKKGCFVGQEVTSRMKRKGEIRKRTLVATFDGPAAAKGCEIMAGDQAIGVVLSSSNDRALVLTRLDRLAAAETAESALRADGGELHLAFPDYLKQV